VLPREDRNLVGLRMAHAIDRQHRDSLATPRWSRLQAEGATPNGSSGPARHPRILSSNPPTTPSGYRSPRPSTPCPRASYSPSLKRRISRSPAAARAWATRPERRWPSTESMRPRSLRTCSTRESRGSLPTGIASWREPGQVSDRRERDPRNPPRLDLGQLPSSRPLSRGNAVHGRWPTLPRAVRRHLCRRASPAPARWAHEEI
jgi:hypothetical protein